MRLGDAGPECVAHGTQAAQPLREENGKYYCAKFCNNICQIIGEGENADNQCALNEEGAIKVIESANN